MNAWFKEIDRATTEAELVAHARDFCSLMHPRDLEPLPKEYREIRIENDADIPRLREKLAQGYADVRSHASEVEKLRDLLSYLAKASERLGQIRGASSL
jgi:hypothetical protein